MDLSQLAALSESDVERMGGATLFAHLGIDLFAIRNASKLEAINALSKKELLQLSPQDIERMGGAELFIKAGKRIRYKTFREVCDEYLSRWNKKDYKGQMQRVDYWCRLFGDRIMLYNCIQTLFVVWCRIFFDQTRIFFGFE
ncbi:MULTISPECIES: hypothetical protein [Methylomonas]|uniref:Uncharacterized protein n=1 Tax=Methylomonas koyamae TaxID=702114 RepID=A0A177P435_9GAMM|nr:hypothetical protein [Methylomonas koyamae]OAI25067.1 hypothetical protein A1355_20050 [Methylomonas koyamae]